MAKKSQVLTTLFATLALAAGFAADAAAQPVQNILSSNSYLCLQERGSYAGAALVQGPSNTAVCTGGVSEQFKAVPVSGGYFNLVSAESGLCVDLPASNTTPGTQLQVWTCNGGLNQQWAINPLVAPGEAGKYNGTYNISYAADNTKCIDVPAFSTTVGTQLQIWSCNGGVNQQYTFGGGLESFFSTSGSINFPGSAPVQGRSSIAVYSDGSYAFSGGFHDSGAWCYNDDMIWGLRSNSGHVFTFSRSGSMGGTFCGGSRDDGFVLTGNNPTLAAYFSDIFNGYAFAWTADTSFDWSQVYTALEEAAGAIADVIDVVG